jgi:hypothetical protein
MYCAVYAVYCICTGLITSCLSVLYCVLCCTVLFKTIDIVALTPSVSKNADAVACADTLALMLSKLSRGTTTVETLRQTEYSNRPSYVCAPCTRCGGGPLSQTGTCAWQRFLRTTSLRERGKLRGCESRELGELRGKAVRAETAAARAESRAVK